MDDDPTSSIIVRPPPQTAEELKQLVECGDIEIMLAEDLPDGTSRLLLCDHRRLYNQGEIYEIII